MTLGTETRPYWWLHLTEELEAQVDYAASSFHIETPAEPGVDAPVSSRDELDGIAHRLVDSLSGMLTPRRVTFAPGTPAYDFFCLQVTARSFYASERLADRLSSADVTGIELAPSDVEFLFRRENEPRLARTRGSRGMSTRVAVGIHVHAEPARLAETLAAVERPGRRPFDVLLLPDGPDARPAVRSPGCNGCRSRDRSVRSARPAASTGSPPRPTPPS